MPEAPGDSLPERFGIASTLNVVEASLVSARRRRISVSRLRSRTADS